MIDAEFIKNKFSVFWLDETPDEAKIAEELLAAQREPMDIGGYYLRDDVKTEKVMRPSAVFNSIIDSM